MHFLEDHAVPWIKKWRTGFGVLGEQGGESIHSLMRLSARTTAYPTKWSDYTTLWKPTIHKCAQNLKNVLRVLLGKKRDYKKLVLYRVSEIS